MVKLSLFEKAKAKYYDNQEKKLGESLEREKYFAEKRQKVDAVKKEISKYQPKPVKGSGTGVAQAFFSNAGKVSLVGKSGSGYGGPSLSGGGFGYQYAKPVKKVLKHRKVAKGSGKTIVIKL